MDSSPRTGCVCASNVLHLSMTIVKMLSTNFGRLNPPLRPKLDFFAAII